MQLKIGERFKLYESAFQGVLPPRMPVIIRVDGRAFHTLTRRLRCEKPFDMGFAEKMAETTLSLAKHFEVVIAFQQSDEISLLLLNDATHETQPMFGNEINKLVSTSAALASARMSLILGSEACFDSRAFIVPREEIVNYLIWRQVDCLRNARNIWSECTLGKKVGMGTARKMLNGVSGNEKVRITEEETGETFSDVPNHLRNGLEVSRDQETRKFVVNIDTPWYIDEGQHVDDIMARYYGRRDG